MTCFTKIQSDTCKSDTIQMKEVKMKQYIRKKKMILHFRFHQWIDKAHSISKSFIQDQSTLNELIQEGWIIENQEKVYLDSLKYQYHYKYKWIRVLEIICLILFLLFAAIFKIP